MAGGRQPPRSSYIYQPPPTLHVRTSTTISSINISPTYSLAASSCTILRTAHRYHNMKSGLVFAAAAFAGLANCGVHKLKLEKVPLSEQLEHADIATHAKSLYKKYSGQRFMGIRPEAHMENMFRDTSVHSDQDHYPVPVSNFLNAQCLSYPTRSTL